MRIPITSKKKSAEAVPSISGFASLDLGGNARIGIVDVPGHERFIKNMLAGASGRRA